MSPRHLISAALCQAPGREELVAAGVTPNAPAAAPLSMMPAAATPTLPAAVIETALAPDLERGEPGAAGCSQTPAAPLAADLDPATELTIAATLYLMRAPDFNTAHKRLRAAVDALPISLVADACRPSPTADGCRPSPTAMAPLLLDFRIAAEMTLRAHRSPVGMRAAEAVLDRTRAAYCARVRKQCAEVLP